MNSTAVESIPLPPSTATLAPQGPLANAPSPAAPLPCTSRWGLVLLFWLASKAPWMLRVLKPLAVTLTLRCSAAVRHGTQANARRLLSGNPSAAQCRGFARSVVGNFYDFITEVAHSGQLSPEQLRARMQQVQGHDTYCAARKPGGGAIIVTAHMGSFETGLAMLAALEPHVHVVFKRDEMPGFEAIRHGLRTRLGILEAPIDEGWPTWKALHSVLAGNHVVVMQGDRAMPGQKSQTVPMLGGHVRLPLGPIKLAQLSGCPIIPIFTAPASPGQSRIVVEPPIHVNGDAPLVNGVYPALLELAGCIEKHVRAHPAHWLMLHPAFVEDATKAPAPAHFRL